MQREIGIRDVLRIRERIVAGMIDAERSAETDPARHRYACLEEERFVVAAAAGNLDRDAAWLADPAIEDGRCKAARIGDALRRRDDGRCDRGRGVGAEMLPGHIFIRVEIRHGAAEFGCVRAHEMRRADLTDFFAVPQRDLDTAARTPVRSGKEAESARDFEHLGDTVAVVADPEDPRVAVRAEDDRMVVVAAAQACDRIIERRRFAIERDDEVDERGAPAEHVGAVHRAAPSRGAGDAARIREQRLRVLRRDRQRGDMDACTDAAALDRRQRSPRTVRIDRSACVAVVFGIGIEQHAGRAARLRARGEQAAKLRAVAHEDDRAAHVHAGAGKGVVIAVGPAARVDERRPHVAVAGTAIERGVDFGVGRRRIGGEGNFAQRDPVRDVLCALDQRCARPRHRAVRCDFEAEPARRVHERRKPFDARIEAVAREDVAQPVRELAIAVAAGVMRPVFENRCRLTDTVRTRRVQKLAFDRALGRTVLRLEAGQRTVRRPGAQEQGERATDRADSQDIHGPRVRPSKRLSLGSRAAEHQDMGSPAVLNASVFLFFFAFGYLLSAKRPILTRSTRFVLIALFASAAGFALTTDPRLKDLLATVTIAINVAFIAFAAIDFIAWRKRTN